MSQRLALIIGNSSYQDSTLSRLLTPDADVGALGEILLDPELGGFDDVNVLVNMSSHIIRRAIASFFSKKAREDLLLLYFSGHGVLDDQGLLYLAVRDTDSKLLRGTAISAHYISEEMNNSRSQRQVLVLDCCHSGAFARGSKGKPGASVGTAPAFEGSGFGRVVLTASDATQYAWEGDQVIGEAQNSLFTHYMVRGIRSGEADFNGDGRITVDELYDYVYARVTRQTPKQTPGKWSYKEQGDIVIAQAADISSDRKTSGEAPVFERDLQERLEKLYTDGLSAFWLKDWEKAVYCFQAILELRPDYPDVAEKLELSRRKQRLQALYQRALAAEETQDWSGAIARLEELLRIEPDYPEAAKRLKDAERKRQLSDLYQQAVRLFQAQEWQAVVNVFDQIANLQPDYPDPQGLLPIAQAQVAELERQAERERTYSLALRELDAGRWSQAEELLTKLQALEPGYRGADQLLERAREENKRQQQARQLGEQTAALYAQALELAQAEQWRAALQAIEEILALDPEFQDAEGLAGKARSELAQQEQQAQQQERLDEMYAAAVAALQAGQYPKALDHWAEVQALDPGYPDRQKVAKTAHQKLEAIAKPRRGTRVSRRAALWVGIAIVVVAAAALGGYLLWGRQTYFYDDFSDARFAGSYNDQQWLLWVYPFDREGYIFLGGAAQQEDGTLKMDVRRYQNWANLTTSKLFNLSKTTFCQTRMRLDPVSDQGSIQLALNLYVNKRVTGGAYCNIYQDPASQTGQWGECYSHRAGVDQGETEHYIFDFPPGSWHTLRIAYDPDKEHFNYVIDEAEAESKLLSNAEKMKDAQIRCKISVSDQGKAEEGVVGYFDYVKMDTLNNP